MSNYKLLKDGTIAQGVVELTEDGQIASPVPFFQQDLIGSVKNWYPNRIRGFVFGKKTGLNDALSDLWGGPTAIYQFPSSPIRMQISSTNANDTAAGTGLRQILIHYLDDNYLPQIEIVTLNGLTPVLTAATNILRINGMHAVAVGSNLRSVGAISLTNLAATITYGFIDANFTSSRQAIFTVPDGVFGYINHWQLSSGSTGNHFCQTILAASTREGISYPGVFLLQDEHGSQNNGAIVQFPIPIPIPPKTDVRISAISDAPNAGVTALGAIMGWFEPV